MSRPPETAMVVADPISALRSLAETTREPLLVLDHALRVFLANPSFASTFGIEPDEARGKLVYDLGDGRWDAPDLRVLLEEILPEAGRRDGFEFAHDFGRAGHRSLRINARCLHVADRPGLLILLAIEDATESRPPTREPAEGEGRLRRIFESIKDFSIFTTDPDGVVTSWNAGAENVFGYRAGEIIGRSAEILFTPEDCAAGIPRRERDRAASEGRAADERWQVKKGGMRLFARGIITPLTDESGATIGFTQVARDITERKVARSELLAVEKQRRTIMDAVPALICYLDRDLRYRIANESYRTWFGRSPDAVIGKTVAEVVGEETGARLLPFMKRALAGERQRFEHEIRDREGKSRTVQLTYSPDHDESGQVVGIVILASDISDRKAMEETLRAGEERWRGLFEGMAEGFFLGEIVRDPASGLTVDVRFLELNPAFGTLTGLPVAETIGRTMREAIPGIQEDLIQVYGRVAETREPTRFEVFIPALGDRWYEARARHVEGDRISVLFMDITDRKAVEAALRASEERFRQLADAMPQIVFMARPDGHVDYFNRRWYEYTGLADVGLTGDASWESVHEPGNIPRVLRVWNESLRTGRPYEIEYRLRRADGAFRWHLGRALPVRDEAGVITRWFGTNTDIDDQKRAEEALVDARNEAEAANRMKDEFLAVLSHELRTPLNAIVGWSRILRSGASDADDLEEGLAAIERNGNIQSQLIEDLLDISRIVSGQLRLELQPVNLVSVIEAALEAGAPSASAKQIRMVRALDPLAGPVSGDPARLQQVAWNLVTNAIKFTPPGGEVRVTLGRAGDQAEIRVVDNGLGIRPDFLPHVFDRFRQADSSTTRRHGGLGLGLSIVRQLVEMHGGTIRAESPGAGLGSTFTVTLPILAAPADPPAGGPGLPDDDGAASLGRDASLDGLRVLVVDDEPDARQLLHRALAGCGADVAQASSVDEALELVERFRPEVVVSDIGMPDRDGYDLIRAIRAAHSSKQIPAAALTAFAHAEDRKKALLAGFQTHIAKPVDPAELTAVVASLAGRTGRDRSHQGGDHRNT